MSVMYVLERKDRTWIEMLRYGNPFAIASKFLRECGDTDPEVRHVTAHELADDLRDGCTRTGTSQYSGRPVRVRRIEYTPRGGD